MNVSLPVSTPILRGAAAASSMLASVLSTLNEASLMAATPSILDNAVIAPRGYAAMLFWKATIGTRALRATAPW